MNFLEFSNIALPHFIDLKIELKLLSTMIKSELSLATSHPDPIQNPTLAVFKAYESAILSPAIPIIPLSY